MPKKAPAPITIRKVRSSPKKGGPKLITAGMLRQKVRRAAQKVLNDIELLGGEHRCYDCPHAEEDHAFGECVKCWDERTRYHPFVSFLTGASRYFAELEQAGGDSYLGLEDKPTDTSTWAEAEAV